MLGIIAVAFLLSQQKREKVYGFGIDTPRDIGIFNEDLGLNYETPVEYRMNEIPNHTPQPSNFISPWLAERLGVHTYRAGGVILD